MEESLYEMASCVEKDHWWFKARREIIVALIDLWIPQAICSAYLAQFGGGIPE